jgi:hypothetical protein
VEVSCDSNHLVAYEMQSDKRWPRLVKKVSADSFLDVGAQFVPSFTLCEDIVAETFSDESSVLFLVYAEDDFHALNFGRSKPSVQAAFVE